MWQTSIEKIANSKPVSVYSGIVGKLSYWLALAMFFSLFAPVYFLKIVVVVWMSFWLAEFRWLNYKNITIDKTLIPLAIILGLYLYSILSFLWTVDSHETALYLRRQIYFLVVIPVLVFGVNDYYKPKNMIYAMMIGALFFSVLYYFTIYCSASYNMMYEDGVNNWQKVPLWRISERLKVFRFHTFFSLSLLIVGIAALFLRKNIERVEGKWSSYFLMLLFTLAIIASIYVSGTRATMLCIPILAFTYIAWKYKFKIWVYILIALLIIGGSVYLLLNYHFHSSTTIEVVSGAVAEGSDARFTIWGYALDIFKEHPILGGGFGTSRVRMEAYYNTHDVPPLFLYMGYGTDCQYLATLLDLGIPALIVYVIGLFLIHRYYLSDRTRLFALLYSISLAIHCGFANISDKITGIIIECMVFLLLNWMHRCDKKGVEW